MKTLVIARYNEDLSWVNQLLNENFLDEIIIYNKGDRKTLTRFFNNKVKIRNVRNLGREGGTYLAYILQNYKELPENMWFTQGNPFEHSPDFLKFLKKDTFLCYKDKGFQGMSTRWLEKHNIPPNKFVNINTAYNINDARTIDYFINSSDMQLVAHSKFHDTGVIDKLHVKEDVSKDFCEKTNLTPPKKFMRYIWSACFYVEKKHILRHSFNTYLDIQKFLYTTNVQGGYEGYTLERHWHYIFTGESYESLNECFYELFSKCDKRKVYIINESNKTITKRMIGEVKDMKFIEQNDCNVVFFIHGKKKVLPGIKFEIDELPMVSLSTSWGSKNKGRVVQMSDEFRM